MKKKLKVKDIEKAEINNLKFKFSNQTLDKWQND